MKQGAATESIVKTTTKDASYGGWLIKGRKATPTTAPATTTLSMQTPIVQAPMPVFPVPLPVITPVQSESSAADSDSSSDNGRAIIPHYQSAFAEQQTPSIQPTMITTSPHVGHVPNKLKRKILAGQYMDLNKLYRMDTINDAEPCILVRGFDLKLSSKPKTHDIVSFSRFFDCFSVYMTIRGSVYPHEFPSMLRHMEIVKMLHGQGNDGILYDKQFRIMKADNPTLQWGVFMAELVTRRVEVAKGFQFANTFSSYPRIDNRPQRQQATCNHFNNGKCIRVDCKYKHACSACFKRSHGKSTCRVAKSTAP